MTAARRLEKAAAALLLAALCLLLVRMAAAALVVNPATGLAISGFDSVAHFTEGKLKPSRPEFELGADGAVWHFRGEGNRAAFEEHPEVYRPAFGRYDLVTIRPRARRAQAPGALDHFRQTALPVL